MGVVVRRYIDILTIIINFPYSTCISSFLQQHPTSLFILKIFFSFFHIMCSVCHVTCSGLCDVSGDTMQKKHKKSKSSDPVDVSKPHPLSVHLTFTLKSTAHTIHIQYGRVHRVQDGMYMYIGYSMVHRVQYGT